MTLAPDPFQMTRIFFKSVECDYSDKKENQIFLKYKEIQSGAVAKSYMTNGLLIYGEIFAHFLIQYIKKPFLIYDFATSPSEFP